MHKIETATDARVQGEPGAAGRDEITAAFEHKRAGRATGDVNTSPGWQVRIGWHSEPPTIWSPFTFDRKDTEEDAEYCARQAVHWKGSDKSLYVTNAWVRAPGESKWQPVNAPRTTCA